MRRTAVSLDCSLRLRLCAQSAKLSIELRRPVAAGGGWGVSTPATTSAPQPPPDLFPTMQGRIALPAPGAAAAIPAPAPPQSESFTRRRSPPRAPPALPTCTPESLRAAAAATRRMTAGANHGAYSHKRPIWITFLTIQPNGPIWPDNGKYAQHRKERIDDHALENSKRQPSRLHAQHSIGQPWIQRGSGRCPSLGEQFRQVFHFGENHKAGSLAFGAAEQGMISYVRIHPHGELAMDQRGSPH